MLRKIYDEELVNGQCYGNLRYLCKNIGQRLSGSPNAQKAVEWSKKLMESYGFDKVFFARGDGAALGARCKGNGNDH